MSLHERKIRTGVVFWVSFVLMILSPFFTDGEANGLTLVFGVLTVIALLMWIALIIADAVMLSKKEK